MKPRRPRPASLHRHRLHRLTEALRAPRCLAAGLAGLPLLMSPSAWSQAIQADGRTATTVTTAGSVTDIRTGTVSGNTGFNSFRNFSVNAGQTANLHVPTGALNLVNIVRDSRTDIDGTLNAIRDGRIGGNVYFANPNGFVVGASGVVNVGALSISTPTRGFVDRFFSAPGVVDAGALGELLNGTAPLSSAAIRIDGRVNAIDGVELAAGTVSVRGAILTGARFEGRAPDFTDVVNAQGLANGTRVVERAGRIYISADEDIEIAGTLDARGAAGVDGGDIRLRAGRDLVADMNALVTASGDGEASSGGRIDALAQRNAVIRSGAVMDASAGRSGDGGFIEFSAKDTVELAGGQFYADGRGGGAAGHVLIDPANILLSANLVRGAGGYGTLPDGASAAGANLELLATNSITVNDNIVVSSRLVASDHVGGQSIGHSGNITFTAPNILLKSGSKVLAHASGNLPNGDPIQGGDITFTAHQASAVSILGYREASASIELDNATVKGRNVTMTASTDVQNRWLFDDASFQQNATNFATEGATGLLGIGASLLGINIVHSQAVGTATITLKSGSLVEATQDVTLKADNLTSAGAAPDTGISGPGTLVNTPLGLGALYARNSADAKVEVKSGATVRASNLTVRANNDATLEASIEAADPGEDASSQMSFAIGLTFADVKSKATVEAGATLQVSGDVTVAATNRNAFTNSVTASLGNSGKAAAAIAVSELSSSATAALNANVSDATSVKVIAVNDNTTNATTAEAKVGTTLNQAILEAAKEKAKPLTDTSGFIEEKLWEKVLGGAEVDSKATKPQSTALRIGGAIAWVDSDATASASIGPNARVHASDSAVVAARTLGSDIQVMADASAVSQSKQSATGNTARNTFSAGIAIGKFSHDALATIGRGATVTAPRIAVASDVIIPVRETLITGGSFTRWDGLSTVKDWFNDLTGILDVFNGASSAKSTSDNSNNSIAAAGSFSLLQFDHAAKTEVQESAKLNLTGSQTGAWTAQYETVADDTSTSGENEQVLQEWAFSAPADLSARRDVTLLFHGGHFLPGSAGGGSGSKGLGMAYTQEILNGDSLVFVREGAAIQGVTESSSGTTAGQRSYTVTATRATDEIAIAAEGKDLVISLATLAGYGASFGISGSVSIVEVTNRTRALVDDEATLRAGTLSITALDEPVLWSIAGGFNKGESAGVGVGIAYNGVSGTTEALVGDNDSVALDDGGSRSSQVALTNAVIQAGDVTVEARASGRMEAIAVTGAVATSDSSSSSGGFFGSIKNKYDEVQGKLARIVDLKPTSASSQGNTSSQGSQSKPSFGLAGAGSAAVNDVTLVTRAKLAGVKVEQGDGSPAQLTVRGVSDLDIVTASGAAAFTRANNPSQNKSAAVTGSVSVNLIDNTVEGLIDNAELVDTGDVTVQALAGGEQLSIAIGVAINASSQSQQNSVSATGSLSLSIIDNTVRAALNSTDLTGATGSGRDLDVTAYNRMFIGTGGGTLAIGGKTGAGGAVTYSDVANIVTAEIAGGSAVSGVDTVKVRGFNATEIGAGAAHGQASASNNANAVGGAVVITEIENDTTARISGLSSVTATTSVDVLAQDRGAEAGLEDIIEPGTRRENTAKGLDYCGRSGAGATPTGNCITSVAGVLQVNIGSNSNSVGGSFNWSSIDNDLTAKVEDSKVDVTSSTGRLNVKAESDVLITSIAVGVGVSSKVSGVGSVAVNFIDNDLVAGISAPQQNGAFDDVKASAVTVQASDRSRIDTLAGGFAASMNSVAIGASVTYAEIFNTVQAQIDRAHVDAAATLNLTASSDARIRSLAVAGGLALGGSPAVSASIAVNFIGNTTEATVDDALIEDSATGAANGNAVTISAADRSTLQSLAGAVAIGIGQNAVGAAFGYNKIGNHTLASVENSTVRSADTLTLTATEASTIETLALAAGGAQTVALSGSVTVNHIGKYAGDSNSGGEGGNVTTAEIVGSTLENTGNDSVISLTAADTSTIKSLAGAAAFSGNTAVGGAVGDNWVRNTAKARVHDSDITGANSLTLGGSNSSLIQSGSVAGAGAATGAFAGSASSNRTDNRTVAEITDSDVGGGTAAVTVNATDTARIDALAGAVGISGSAGVGAALAVNKIANSTHATVSGLKNSGFDVSNLVLSADSLAAIRTLAVGVGGGVDVGVGGSVAINLINSDTRAVIEGGADIESRDNVAVLAESDDKITLMAGAVGIGISAAGVGAAVTVNEIGGATEAAIRDSAVAARAQQGNGVSVNTGEIAGVNLKASVDKMNAGGGGYSSSDPFTAPDLTANRAKENVRGIAVNAMSTHQTTTGVANVAGGTFAGVAATVSVNIIGGDTSATVSNAVLNGGDNSAASSAQAVRIKAADHAYGNTFIGSIAVGAAGVGASADINVFQRNTTASVSGSATEIDAKGGATVKARSTQGVTSIVVGASGGVVGVVGSGSVAKFVSRTEATSDDAVWRVGALDVSASHDSKFFVAGGALALGGVAGAGTFAVGLDTSQTEAHIDGGSVDADGAVNVTAANTAEMRTWAVGGAGGGTAGVAGAVAVGMMDSSTNAYVKGARVGSSGDRSGSLTVRATDSVVTESLAGVAAVGGIAGAGAGASITKIDNTTSATIEDSNVYVTGAVTVDADASRTLNNTAAAAAGGGTVGIGGAVAVTLVGGSLGSDAAGEVNKDGSGTLSKTDSFSNGNALRTGSSGGNVSTSGNFSDSDISRVNASGKVATTSRINGGPTGSTTAGIRDTDGVADTISAGGNVKVSARERDAIDVLAGGLAIGGVAGVGASVSVLDVSHRVDADVSGLTTVSSSGAVEITASTGNLIDGRDAARAKSYQAAGGLVGLGAAVATAGLDNRVSATVGRGVTLNATSTGGAITVSASDSSSVSSHAEGYAVGAVAAGIVVSTATKTGQVTADIADLDARLNAVTSMNWGSGAFTLQATRSGGVDAFARAGAGGVLAGAGSGAIASDTGTVRARVGEDTRLIGGGAAAVNASASPRVNAKAEGFGGSIIAYAGVSVAEATSTSTVDAAVHGQRVEASGLTVSASQYLAPGQVTAHSDAQASGGGLLLGVTATESTAVSTSTVRSAIASGTELDVGGTTKVAAVNDTRQRAEVSGVVLGFLAAGSNDADANSTSTTQASVANGVTGSAGSRLEVFATGSADNLSDAESGSGGILAGAGATADTRTIATTAATLGGGNASGALDADAIQVKAEHRAQWNGAVDTVQAALAGASGATSSNVVVSNVDAQIAASAKLSTRDLDVLAKNVSYKPLLTGNVFNAYAGTGGLISGAAAGSYSLITNNTRAGIGASAEVNVTGDIDNPGRTRVVAVNQLDLYDRTKLDTGGAIAIAQAESSIIANNLAEVTLGEDAQLDSVGDVHFGSRTDADLQTSANARTYGLAGAAMGTSTTVLNYSNRTVIGARADIRADGEINLQAGRDADGVSNDINARARTDLYNKTLAPIIESQLKADAAVGAINYVEVATDAKVRAVENVNLGAIRGNNIADGQGVGKDLWREAAAAVASFFSNLVGQGDVSLDLHGGTSTVTGSAGVRVNGLVDAGIQNKQRLVINYTGANPNNIYDERNISIGEKTEGVRYTISSEDRVANLFNEIARLTTLRGQYAGDAASEAAYDNEINLVTQQLLDDGLATLETVTNAQGVRVSQLVPLNAAPVKYINVQNVLARGGDINVTGDYLVGGSAATLKARKDTEIYIDNNSPFYLRTAKLTIADTGGKLTMNGATIGGSSSGAINSAINARNSNAGGGSAAFGTVQTAASGPTPVIEVRNDYNPPADPRATVSFAAPDIQMTGNVTNVTGTVKVSNAKGSIIVQGLGNQAAPTIIANSLDIAAGKNFVQSYVNGFFNVGGAAIAKDQFGNFGGAWGSVAAESERLAELVPVTTSSYERSVNTEHLAAGPGVIAGNNVFISARYLNINGTVQAGIADWSLTLGSNLDSTIRGFAADYAAKVAAGRKPASALYTLTETDNRAGKIASSYNAETGLIELDGVKVQGGYMQLFGEVISTGGGNLKVVDGYGRVNVTNNTAYGLQINGIDTGNNIEGKIRITDTAYRYNATTGTIVSNHQAAGFNSMRPVTTEITRNGNNILFEQKVVGSNGREVTIGSRSGGSGRATTYATLPGQRYVFTTGDTFEKIDVYQAYQDSAIGFIPSGSGSYDYGPFTSVRQGDPLLSGEYVDQAGQTNRYEFDLTRYSTSSPTRASRKTWSECIASSPGVCWERRYWVEDTWVQGKKDFNVHSLKADYAINVNFLGWDANSADAGVNVTSKAGITLVGGISNLDQITTLTSQQGSINAGSDFGVVSGKTLRFSAETGIGGANAPVLVSLQDGGSVRAITTGGDVALKTLAGDLVIDSVSTGAGKVSLDAERSVLQAASTQGSAVISGDSISLQARTGNIGSAAVPLNLQTDAVDGGVLNAEASGDIAIRHTGSGEVRIQRVASSGGDVTLFAGGTLIDANANETRDTRAESELLSLWDSLNLIDDGSTTRGAGLSRADTLAAYKAQQERDYSTYWLMRNSGNIQGGRYVATAGERQALPQSVSVASYEAQRTAEFQRLQGRFGNTTFDPNYSYQLSTTETANLSIGYDWTAKQLTTALPSSVLFKSTSDTETRIEEANISGRHIRIDTAGGLGKLSGSVEIPADATTLTPTQRLALAAAEPDDISFDSVRNMIVVLQRDDIDIVGTAGQAAQSVQINAGTHAYLGSEQDINIDRVGAGQAIRIKGGGGIYEYALRDTSKAAISGDSLILEASTGSVGRDGRPLTVDIANALTVRSGNGIWLNGMAGSHNATGGLNLQEVFARGDITLDSDGSIADVRGGSRLVALQSQNGAVNLTADGDIGADGSPLRLSAAGVVSADAGGDVHLGAVATTPAPGLRTDLHIGHIDAGGDVSVAAEHGNLTVDGAIRSSGTLALKADGTLSQAAADFTAPGDITVEAGRYIMADGALLRSDSGTIAIDARGDVVVGRIEATQNATANALRITTTGRILDGGDIGSYDLVAATPGAGVTLDAAGGVGNATWNNGSPRAVPDALETDIAKIDAISTAGGVHLDERDGIEVGRIEAQQDAWLRAGGDIERGTVRAERGNIDLLSAGKVTVVDATAVAGSTTVLAEGDILMDAVTAGNGVTLESAQGSVSVSRITGDILSLSAKNDLNLGTLSVGRSLFFNSEAVTARIVHTRNDAPLAMRAVGRQGAPARWVDLTIDSPVGVRFDRFNVLDAEVTMENGYLRIDQGRVENRANFYNPVTHVYMDNTSTVVLPADVQLHHPDRTFANMLLDQWKLVTDPFVVMRDPLHEVVMNTVLDYSGREQSRELIVTRVNTPDKQSAAGQVPQIAAISINVPVDIPAVNSGDDESEEEAEARRRAEEENVQ